MSNRRMVFVSTLLACLGGCSSASYQSPDSGRAAASSGPALCISRGLCTAATSIPSGVDAESCYDGCNWCTCSAEGALTNCTARLCAADGGVPDAR